MYITEFLFLLTILHNIFCIPVLYTQNDVIVMNYFTVV